MATGHMLESNTVEGQLFELAVAMELLEKATPEATRENRISVDIDLSNATASINVLLDLEVANQSGALMFAAKPYLANPVPNVPS